VSNCRSTEMLRNIKAHGLLHYRGRRAGRNVYRLIRPIQRLHITDSTNHHIRYSSRNNSITEQNEKHGTIITLACQPHVSDCRRRTSPRVKHSNLISIRTFRHPEPPLRKLTFASMNIRSLSPLKLDCLLEEFRSRQLDVFLLCETWHDADSVSIRRLRAEGYGVVERARPRSDKSLTSLNINHGGVVIVGRQGVRLKVVHIGTQPTTFECVAARITSAPTSCLVIVVYRTGPITANFFTELTDVLGRLSTYALPLYLAGDINIRLDRPTELNSVEFCDIIASFGLHQHVDCPTHDAGGTIDVVCTPQHLPSPTVRTFDLGISDHRMLEWSSVVNEQQSTYVSTIRRPWRQFDCEAFQSDVRSSELFNGDSCASLAVDDFVTLYDSTISDLLDRQVPARSVSCRRRQSTIWFDSDCRSAKRAMRSCERTVKRRGLSVAELADASSAWHNKKKQYTDLLHQKRNAFWTNRIDADKSQPRRLWKSFDELLGRGHVPVCSNLDAETIHRAFDDKVSSVRTATDDSCPPVFTAAPLNCSMTSFSQICPLDVVKLISSLPGKQCTSDPMPTWLLKDCVHILSPFLCYMFNQSLEHGIVPSVFKSAYITPLLKKSDLDPEDVKSYRPISNLSVISKLLERIVSKQLVQYLTQNKLLPKFQSAYRANHSTETAVLKVMSDILLALDSGNLAMLTLLDLSAAFDSVDHKTLLMRLRISYGLEGTVIKWFESYLHNRTQHVRLTSSHSASKLVDCGVPQGSVLGPLLFVLYTADVLKLIGENELIPHAYADDTQIIGSCEPSKTDDLTDRMSACVSDVASWMSANRLQLNPSKTEVLWCSSSRRLHQIPMHSFQIGSVSVDPVRSARDLGVHLDADLSMKTHVTSVVKGCFSALRLIRSVSRSLSRHALLTLIRALVVSKVDYCITALVGVSIHLLDRLQAVLNAAARLVLSARKFDHITPLLRDLHWLRVPERIQFRLCVLTFRCLHGLGPSYLADSFTRASDVQSCRRLRSSTTKMLVVPPTRRSSLGDRAFPVAAARAWNCLPASIRSESSLVIFRRQLKTFLFSFSFQI
jgi:hypothetical protein